MRDTDETHLQFLTVEADNTTMKKTMTFYSGKNNTELKLDEISFFPYNIDFSRQ